MNSDQLARCPMCGASPSVVERSTDTGLSAWVICRDPKCGFHSAECSSAEAAKLQWASTAEELGRPGGRRVIGPDGRLCTEEEAGLAR